MAGDCAIKVVGIVVEALPNGTYRAQLSNGHNLTAFVARGERLRPRFVPGQRVKLEMSPYDLSEGRILIGSAAE